jgi:hypothetical protein
MSRIALSPKAAKLMKLCELEGCKRLYDLLKACTADGVCPAICMTEGCDYPIEFLYREALSKNRILEALFFFRLRPQTRR